MIRLQTITATIIISTRVKRGGLVSTREYTNATQRSQKHLPLNIVQFEIMHDIPTWYYQVVRPITFQA